MSLTIDQLKAEVRRLRAERDEAVARVRSQRAALLVEYDRRQAACHQVTHLTDELDAHRRRERRPQAEPTAPAAPIGLPQFADRVHGFRFLVVLAWATRIPVAEQPSAPLPAYRIGPHFIASVEALTGLSAYDVADVVMEVLTGKATTAPGRHLHRLRAGDSGSSKCQVRADGAVAYRVNLQTNVPAARRLHFWRLGTMIELAKVGLHDDLTI